MLITSSLLSQPLFYEGLPVEQVDIVIKNAENSSGNIKSLIKTKEGDFFSQTTFDNDLKALTQEFDHIDPMIELIDKKVYITIHLELRPHIRTICFYGNEQITSASLLKELELHAGDVFSRVIFNKAFHKLKALYVTNGYFEAELDYSIEHDEITNEVDVIINIHEGRSGKIRNIYFHNFTDREREEILDLILTKKWNIFISWYTGEGIYHEEVVQRDQYFITNYLQNHGYADADVTIEIQEVPSCNRIDVHVTADRGEMYFTGKITFGGNTLYEDDDIRRCLRIKEKCPYSPDALHETITNITDLYGSCGYIETIVDYELTLEPDCPIYNIDLQIDEGEQFYVGLIKVFGNCATFTSVILQETLLIPGELFNIQLLKATEERLQGIGYFKAVNVYTVRSEGPSGLGERYRDVHIEVEETTTGNFNAFAGVSNAENYFTGLQLTERNFNLSGIFTLWSQGLRGLRGAGEYFHMTGTIGQKSFSYVTSWAKPYFMDTPWIVGFDLERSETRFMSDVYKTDSLSYLLHAKYPLNSFVRFGTHYRIRSPSALAVGSGRINPQVQSDVRNQGLLSGIGMTLGYDSTDNPKEPNFGFRSRLETEYMGVGGDYYWLSFGYINAWYHSVSENTLFKTRADFRYIIPFGSTSYTRMPIDERLFLGGDNSVRGYRPFAIGPKYFKTDEPRGGLSLNLFSLEYIYYMFPKMEAFVFFDAGQLSRSVLNFGALRTSAGFGARINFFEGMPPITLGFGFPINPEDRRDIKRFFFSFGAGF